MDTELAENEELATVKIDIELYRQLREYCDKEYVRFKDFVEESLENAIYRGELEKSADQAKNVLKEVADKCRKVHMAVEQAKEEIDNECGKAYRRGFQRGFYTAFYAAQGKMVKEKIEPLSVVVEGPQLNLFDHGLPDK